MPSLDYTGELRLINSAGSINFILGRLEIYDHREWKSVCSNGFDGKTPLWPATNWDINLIGDMGLLAD